MLKPEAKERFSNCSLKTLQLFLNIRAENSWRRKSEVETEKVLGELSGFYTSLLVELQIQQVLEVSKSVMVLVGQTL